MITATVLKLFGNADDLKNASEFSKSVMAFLFLFCVGIAFNLDIGLVRIIYKLGN